MYISQNIALYIFYSAWGFGVNDTQAGNRRTKKQCDYAKYLCIVVVFFYGIWNVSTFAFLCRVSGVCVFLHFEVDVSPEALCFIQNNSGFDQDIFFERNLKYTGICWNHVQLSSQIDRQLLRFLLKKQLSWHKHILQFDQKVYCSQSTRPTLLCFVWLKVSIYIQFYKHLSSLAWAVKINRRSSWFLLSYF